MSFRAWDLGAWDSGSSGNARFRPTSSDRKLVAGRPGRLQVSELRAAAEVGFGRRSRSRSGSHSHSGSASALKPLEVVHRSSRDRVGFLMLHA